MAFSIFQNLSLKTHVLNCIDIKYNSVLGISTVLVIWNGTVEVLAQLYWLIGLLLPLRANRP